MRSNGSPRPTTVASLLTEALVRLLFQLVGRSFRERSDLLSHHFARLLPGLRAELLQIVGADPIAAPGNAISAHAPAAEVAPDAVLLDAAEESAHVRGGVRLKLKPDWVGRLSILWCARGDSNTRPSGS